MPFSWLTSALALSAGFSGPLIGVLLDRIEALYPMLRGTLRDQVTGQRRPFVRFFACEQDLSHDPPDTPLPDAVVSGAEPLLIVGAIAGGSHADGVVAASDSRGYYAQKNT